MDPSFLNIKSVFQHTGSSCVKKVIGQGEFIAKAQQYPQSVCAAEVCRGLGILSSIEDTLTEQTKARINLTIGSNCQSATHKFNARQKVVSFDSKLSEIMREFLQIRNELAKHLSIEKIAGYQDEVKQRHE